MVDPVAGLEIDRLYTNSPVNGLASDGGFVFAATLGRGDGHPKEAGMSDFDGIAYRGDSTASLGFADINNDILVLSVSGGALEVAHRYTSDTAEVSEHDAKDDYTRQEMIVYGALPEQIVARDGRIYVSMSASDSVQVLDVNPTNGALVSAAVLYTGINPFELAVSSDGRTVYTADRLGETVSKLLVDSNERTAWNVGTLQL
jgi:DNA-binding beta-propeller fold protein YncE